MDKFVSYNEEVKRKITERHGEDYFEKFDKQFTKTGRVKTYIVQDSGIRIFGTDLNILMIKHGVVMKKAALELGCSYQALSRWMYGETSPSDAFMAELRRYFIQELKDKIASMCGCTNVEAIRKIIEIVGASDVDDVIDLI